MSTQLMVPVEIGGRTFQIRKLKLADSRPVFARLQRIFAIYADTELTDGLSGSPLIVANLAGALAPTDLQFYADKFGPTTSVVWDDGRTLMLKEPAAQEEAFAEDFSHQFEWLDACVRLNYSGVIAKIDGAQKSKPDAARLEPTVG